MPLAPGTRLGPYEISAQIGAGGMGEVYRARDIRLERIVALKISKERFTARFETEARAAAALEHPHICRLYDVCREDDVSFLVMEYIEGTTLAGPLPLERVLAYAKQIASALDEAHRKQIVHRDLKPSNILVTPQGDVKLLDFGLAQLTSGPTPEGADTLSPTLTATGTIVGTLRYMAPEQVKGAAVDARTDIFAFGCVLYEMVSGARAFDGDSFADVIAAILDREPPSLSVVSSQVPKAFERIIRLCLAKEPAQRWQSAGDVVRALESIGEEVASVAPTVSVAQRRRVPMAWALSAFALGAVCVAAAWWLTSSRAMSGDAPVVRSRVSTTVILGSDISRVRDLSISRDGSRVVYGGGALTGPLLLQSLDMLEPEPLPGTDGGSSPVFSPEGAAIAFFDQRARALKRVSIVGGPVTTLATVDGLITGLHWGSGNAIVFSTERSGGLMRVADDGRGMPERLSTVAAGEAAHRWPFVLPDGSGVLFTAWGGTVDTSQIAVLRLDSRAVTALIPGGSHPVFAASGHIVYASAGGLRAVGFDPVRLALTTSTPQAIVARVQTQPTGAAQFDVSATGSLVYAEGAPSSAPLTSLVWIDRGGREEPLPLAPRRFGQARVSPDGSRIAVSVGGEGPMSTWVSNPGFTALRRLPGYASSPGWGSWFPQWTPDGRSIVFQGDVGRLFRVSADGTDDLEPLITIDSMVIVSPGGWSPDGAQLMFSYGTSSQIRNGLLRMGKPGQGASTWEAWLDHAGKASAGSISPAADWVAYQSFDSGKYEVYLERFPELGERQTISGEAGGWNPVWSRDGRELFYRRLSDGAMMAVPVQMSPTLRVGTPVKLFDDPGTFVLRPPVPGSGAARHWDLAPDGRFLMVKASPAPTASDPNGFVHVQHWTHELRRLVPSAD